MGTDACTDCEPVAHAFARAVAFAFKCADCDAIDRRAVDCNTVRSSAVHVNSIDCDAVHCDAIDRGAKICADDIADAEVR